MTIEASQINDLLRFVRAQGHDSGDAQLSVLAYALAAACQSCGVDRETALEVIGDCIDEAARAELVPLRFQ